MVVRRYQFYDPDVPADIEVEEGLAAPLRAAFAGHASTRVRLGRQVPAMDAVDELIFLLHTAAEIEHSLLAQYLFAAWSLPDTDPHRRWRETLVGIAREEMGHLLGIQNILLAVAGPLNFEREDYPFNAFYPFPFRLEPMSVPFLARVVLAEMPDPDLIPPELGFDLAQVRADAGEQGEIGRVGALFELLIELAEAIGDDAFHNDSLPFQADPAKWLAEIFDLKLAKVSDSGEAVTLLADIAAQGEGYDEPQTGLPSHFRRLFTLYREARTFLTSNSNGHLADPVTENPTTSDPRAPGYLAFPEARAWAVVFNQRYRWILVSVAHHLLLDANDSARQRLLGWAIRDMRVLSAIALQLRGLPQQLPPRLDPSGRPIVAGAPLELPHSMALPSRPIDRWREHLRTARHHIRQLEQIGAQDEVERMLDETRDRIQWLQLQIEASP